MLDFVVGFEGNGYAARRSTIKYLVQVFSVNHVVSMLSFRNRLTSFRAPDVLKPQRLHNPRFKKFIAYHVWQATERVRTETRLLVDAFLNRGRLKCRDLEASETVGRGKDKGFASGLIPFRDEIVPGSHLVCEVRVMTRVGEGVVGIQLVVTGGRRTQELDVHGAAPGESRSTRAHSFFVDAPVERLSRFECEHENGMVERLRMVTSGGRTSPWFGERLTPNPGLSSLPDWKKHSLAATLATTAAAAVAAKSAFAASMGTGDWEEELRERSAAAAEATSAAASAPAWDIQKEYVTGVVGVRTQERLVGLGVVTRHVTDSHVFSYIWEAPEDTEEFLSTPHHSTKSSVTATDSSSTSGKREKDGNDTASASTSASVAECMEVSLRRLSGATLTCGSDSGKSIANSLVEVSGRDGRARPMSPSPSLQRSMDSSEHTSHGNGASDSANEARPSTASPTPALSRAEAKQRKFAEDMRDRERRREERMLLAKQKEEDLKCLIRGGKSRAGERDDDGCGTPSAMSRTSKERGTGASTVNGVPVLASPGPEEEFASVLRMRRTDARQALERSIALAGAARAFKGSAGSFFDDENGALSTLPVVMGLATWLHEALLPRLVPLPVPAASTTELFQRGEDLLLTARATKARGDNMMRAADDLREERRQRPRRGAMSPAQRAKEVEEREVGASLHSSLPRRCALPRACSLFLD